MTVSSVFLINGLVCSSSCDTEGRKNGRKKKIEEENGGKMTRYGVCLILERGEVSLPEGLQQGMSRRWCVFFSLLVRVVVLLHTLLCF